MDYKIGKRERTNFLDERGRGVDGYRVWYEMPDGTVDYVEIPKSQFTAAAVQAAIEKEIAVHQELAS